jgi:predicted glycosyltransferase involved in capsule biosynthesis
MTSVSIIINHSNTHPSRDRNLRFVIDRYYKILPGAEVIIVEQNTESDLTDFSNIKHHLTIPSPEGYDFSRGYGFNEGYKRSDGGIILFSDNDILLDEKMLRDMTLNIIQGDIEFYVGRDRFLNMTTEMTEKVIETGVIDPDWEKECRNRPSVAANGCGGSCIVRADAFERVKGWEPNMHGWGYEDHAFCHKLEALCNVRKVPAPMWHMDHDKKAHKAHARQNGFVEENHEKYKVIKQMVKKRQASQGYPRLHEYIDSLPVDHFKKI